MSHVTRSECSSIDSDVGSLALTPPSTPVTRSRLKHAPAGLNIFPY